MVCSSWGDLETPFSCVICARIPPEVRRHGQSRTTYTVVRLVLHRCVQLLISRALERFGTGPAIERPRGWAVLVELEQNAR